MIKDYLGVRNVLWLGDGIEGDDTDGHVDDLTRFVNRTTVVTVIEEDEHDPNHEPLQANLHRLRQMTTEDGAPLHVLTMPMPSKIVREGQRLPASYANFYIANKVVLLPAFGDPNDAWAASVLRQALPGRRIVSIDCRELIWGLGGFPLPDAATAGLERKRRPHEHAGLLSRRRGLLGRYPGLRPGLFLVAPAGAAYVEDRQ